MREEVVALQGGTTQRENGLIVAIAIFVVVLLTLLLGGGMMGFGMMAPWMGGGFFNPIWMILMVLFWAVIIGGTVLAIVWLVSQGRPMIAGLTREETPLEILKRRYAKGEITHDEYEKMRRDLE